MQTEDQKILDNQLFECIKKGEIPKIEMLLVLGADLNALDNQKRKPFYYVRDVKTLEYLLGKGVDVNSVIDENNGFNLLCSLCKRKAEDDFEGRYDLIKYLRDNGGKIETKKAKDRGFDNALSIAVCNFDLEALKILLEKYDINTKSSHDRNLLMEVLECSCFSFKMMKEYKDAVEVAEYLIDEGIDIKAVDEYGMNAVFFATKDEKILRKVIDKGGDVNCISKYGVTPLSFLIDRAPFHEKGAVKVLLENGANPNLGIVKGEPILALAIEEDVDEDDIVMMIEKGADVNKKNSRGDTPLLLAVGDGPILEKVAKKLIEKGADVNVIHKGVFSEEQNALSYALYKNNDELCYMLLEKECKILPKDWEIIDDSKKYKIKKMLELISYRKKAKEKEDGAVKESITARIFKGRLKR